MRRVVASDDVVRLVRAAERMARLAQEIGARAQSASTSPSDADISRADPPATCPSTERLVQASRDAIAAHLGQPDFGAPAFFRNPAWLLLLELFVADRSGAAVSVKAACLTLGGATSTAMRTILDLERLDLIASRSDEKDARRRLLTLTPRAEAALRVYLNRMVEQAEPSIRLSLKMSQGHDDPRECHAPHPIQPSTDRSVLGIETILQ